MIKIQQPRRRSGAGLRVALVASRYNELYVNGMLNAAKEHLEAAGAVVEAVRVPGAFEIPVTAACLARRTVDRPDAIICLGVIWQGETDHAQHIGGAVTAALMTLQIETGVPCVHEVLTVRTVEQARVRCLEAKTNRGLEAASTALEIGKLLRRLTSKIR
jgi:6,7-dimethyl-8-ribityllumazine synthase